MRLTSPLPTPFLTFLLFPSSRPLNRFLRRVPYVRSIEAFSLWLARPSRRFVFFRCFPTPTVRFAWWISGASFSFSSSLLPRAIVPLSLQRPSFYSDSSRESFSPVKHFSPRTSFLDHGSFCAVRTERVPASSPVSDCVNCSLLYLSLQILAKLTALWTTFASKTPSRLLFLTSLPLALSSQGPSFLHRHRVQY